MNIAGVLLAAGSSRRFGSDKRRHRLADGTPMALAAARRLAAACPDTVVVLRPQDGELAALLSADGFRCVACAQAELGMGHSLAAGVAACAGDEVDGWLVALADMPFIAPASYASVRALLAHGARIARPMFGERMGHPVGFCARYRSRLLALTGDAGGRAIIAEDPSALVVCRVDDPGVLQDIDEARLIE